MKYLMTIAMIIFFVATNALLTGLIAQKLIVSDTTIIHDGTERPCIRVVMEPEPKDIKGYIQDWLKDEYKIKLKGFGFLANADVLTAEQVTLSNISDKQLDFFVSVVKDGDYSKMCVFGSFGYNIHITPENYPSEYHAMKRLVFNFMDDFLPHWYQNRIDETQNLITDLDKEHNKLQDDLAKNEKEIEDLQKENIKMSEKIGQIKTDLQENTEILRVHKEKLNGINSMLEITKSSNIKVSSSE